MSMEISPTGQSRGEAERNGGRHEEVLEVLLYLVWQLRLTQLLACKRGFY